MHHESMNKVLACERWSSLSLSISPSLSLSLSLSFSLFLFPPYFSLSLPLSSAMCVIWLFSNMCKLLHYFPDLIFSPQSTPLKSQFFHLFSRADRGICILEKSNLVPLACALSN